VSTSYNLTHTLEIVRQRYQRKTQPGGTRLRFCVLSSIKFFTTDKRAKLIPAQYEFILSRLSRFIETVTYLCTLSIRVLHNILDGY